MYFINERYSLSFLFHQLIPPPEKNILKRPGGMVPAVPAVAPAPAARQSRAHERRSGNQGASDEAESARSGRACQRSNPARRQADNVAKTKRKVKQTGIPQNYTSVLMHNFWADRNSMITGRSQNHVLKKGGRSPDDSPIFLRDCPPAWLSLK